MPRTSLLALALVGCSSTAASPDATVAPTVDAAPDLRGARYCEILLGTIASAMVEIKVYNTVGLNDCPDAAWSAIDSAAIKADTGADVVILNGPSYWMINSAAGSTLIDPTVRALGGIEMRQAGAIAIPLAEIATAQQPYTPRTIMRDSAFTFRGGAAVFELTDDLGHVYTMQSYSVQDHPQTEATLPELASALTLPAGWGFRTRTLAADLTHTAVDQQATVVADDYRNTYLQSQ